MFSTFYYFVKVFHVWHLCSNLHFEPFQEVDGLNIYDILEPCYHGSSSKIRLESTKLPISFRRLGETERPLPVRKRMFGRAWPFRAPVKDGYVPSWPQLLNDENVPCTVSNTTLLSLVG